jgi:hypothetical protein
MKKMKIIYSLLLLFTISSTVFLSCSKHKGDIEENIPVATINFASPTASSVYQKGDSVLIKATAISTATVHGYDIVIRKTNDTTKVFFEHVHDHNDTLIIDKKWKSNLPSATNMEAQVILYLDHEGHTGSKKVSFRIQ